jgi:hypothetical protein
MLDAIAPSERRFSRSASSPAGSECRSNLSSDYRSGSLKSYHIAKKRQRTN